MARLRTSVEEIERVMKSRGEGLGIRATARVFGKSPSSITLWEERLSAFEWIDTQLGSTSLATGRTAHSGDGNRIHHKTHYDRGIAVEQRL